MNEMDLKTLCMYTNNSDELLGYFYKMSYSMKKLHDKGFCISDFKSNKILYDNKSNEFIFRVEEMRPDTKEENIKSDIIKYASLVTNLYINKSNLFNSDILFPENYLKEVVENFRYSYNDIDYPYFYDLYKNNDVIYYHEYIDKKKQDLENRYKDSKNLVKATSVGAMLDTDKEDVFNKAAFISVPVVFVMSMILMFLMIIIFVITNQ